MMMLDMSKMKMHFDFTKKDKSQQLKKHLRDLQRGVSARRRAEKLEQETEKLKEGLSNQTASGFSLFKGKK